MSKYHKLIIKNHNEVILTKDTHIKIKSKKSPFLNIKKTRWIYYNFDFDLKTKLNNFIEKMFIKKADHILIPSQSRLKVYKKNFDRINRIYSINNCFSKELKIKKFKKYNKFYKKKNI